MLTDADACGQHHTRVKLFGFHFHQWLCAFQEALISNAAFVFFKALVPFYFYFFICSLRPH